MLTVLENLQETMKADGHPDRFVNQYEFLNVMFPTVYYMGDYPMEPGKSGYDQYGVLWDFPHGQMGPFPVHSGGKKLLNDVTEWKNVLTHLPIAPPDPGYWGMLNGIAASTDMANAYPCALVTQGVFERLHAMMGMEDTMIAMYEEPEATHELIDFITEAELDFAKNIMDNVPMTQAILHHDDWGSVKNSFLSPDMFDEFILPAYKKIYGYWKERGIKCIVHHNDAYSANLVPEMIEMGMDIWQGAFPENDIPKLQKEYAGKITFMGEIQTRLIDLPDWTEEAVAEEVERACRKCKGNNFIPCLTGGVPAGHFPGVYESVTKNIDRMSKEMF
ncbi:MAG: uroporphyrinogen decarboxylase [Parasporobacterium sp.]|nr:uroporphyrinogen decarboxylase [Parasporobacterium sp.]